MKCSVQTKMNHFNIFFSRVFIFREQDVLCTQTQNITSKRYHDIYLIRVKFQCTHRVVFYPDMSAIKYFL